MDWFKCSTRLFQNPKVMLAGEDAVLLFLQLLSLNAQEGLDGRITGPRAHPLYLARLMSMLGVWDQDRLQEALEACASAKLIELDAEGAIEVVGWDDSWRTPKSAAERKRDERSRKQRDDGHDSGHAPVTSCHAGNVTPRDSVTPRERRERRERGGDVVDSDSLSPRRTPTADGAGGEPRSGQGPARPPAPPPRGRRTIDERKAELGAGALEQLEVLEEFLGGGRTGAHELLDLAWSLDSEGWEIPWTRSWLERIRGSQNAWRKAALRKLSDPGKREQVRAERAELASRARDLDHHFALDVDTRLREEAARDSADTGLDQELCFELGVAERYRQQALHGERSFEQIPVRYRKHLAELSLSVAPRAYASREAERADAQGAG